MGRPKLTVKRICVACDSTTTYIDKNGWVMWRFHDGDWFCNVCYQRYVAIHRYYPQPNRKFKPHFMFLGKPVYTKDEPRKGECNLCHKKVGDKFIDYYGKERILKGTDLHHIEYHKDDPLKDTVELCDSCHMKESRAVERNERLKKQIEYDEKVKRLFKL